MPKLSTPITEAMNASPLPINALTRHFAPLQERLQAAASEVIGSGYFVLGPSVKAFENAFAAYCGVEHCVGVANGTDALELALRAVGVSRGDQVAVTANCAMYGTSAVLACGAEPVFVEVEAGAATMDVHALAGTLDAHPQVKACIVTHLYGRLANIEAIAETCHRHHVRLVEDCAQAHGARRPGGPKAGAFGDVASFSFYPTKNLGALGDGGAVLSGDAQTATRVRQLRQYGWDGKYNNVLSGGRNSRLDELQARLLLELLPLLDQWNDRRRAIANRYSREIRSPHIDVPAPAGEEYVAHLYVVRSAQRDALRQHLAEAGIQTDVHYPVCDHRQACHHGLYDHVQLPLSETEAVQVLTLPCFPEMSEAETRSVIDACNRF